MTENGLRMCAEHVMRTKCTLFATDVDEVWQKGSGNNFNFPRNARDEKK